MDVFTGTNIYAAGGLAGQHDLGTSGELPRYNDLLHISAGEISGLFLLIGCFDAVALNGFPAPLGGIVPVDHPVGADGRNIMSPDDQIFQNGSVQS